MHFQAADAYYIWRQETHQIVGSGPMIEAEAARYDFLSQAGGAEPPAYDEVV